MNTKDKVTAAVALALARFPSDYHARSDATEYKILEASGYLEAHEDVSEQDIKEALQSDTRYLADWLQFSEDKRCLGWCLARDEDGWRVGYWSRSGQKGEDLRFGDGIDACAAFVKREMESIRKNYLEVHS